MKKTKKIDNYPTKEGVYFYKEPYIHGFEGKIEVYEGPNGVLCVWCDDIGMSLFEQDFSLGDEMNGHIMLPCLDGEWKYLRGFDE